MYKNVLTSIPGIEWYPIAALVLFFGFFTLLLLWFAFVDTARLGRLSAAALDEGRPAANPAPSSSHGEYNNV